MGPVWTVPPGRIKDGRRHQVPLSGRVVEILSDLKAVPRESGNPHVFIGLVRGRGLSKVAMSKLLTRMHRTDTTVHGPRSCFRDWTAENTSFENIVCEMALAHIIPIAAEKAYRRGKLFNRRRELMDARAAYAVPPTAVAGKVVAMPARKRK